MSDRPKSFRSIKPTVSSVVVAESEDVVVCSVVDSKVSVLLESTKVGVSVALVRSNVVVVGSRISVVERVVDRGSNRMVEEV